MFNILNIMPDSRNQISNLLPSGNQVILNKKFVNYCALIFFNETLEVLGYIHIAVRDNL